MKKKMITTKSLLVFTVLFLFLSFETGVCSGHGREHGIDCHSACQYRCSKSGRPKMCIRACNTCCERCHCVPPGTSGHKDECPCYAKMKTHGGKLKCP